MKVIILDHEPYSLRKENHYKIREFIASGVDVEFWCMVDVLPYLRGVQYNYRETGEIVSYISSFEEFKLRVSIQSSETIFIVEMYYRYDTIDFFTVLKKANIKCVKIDYYFNPTNCLNVHKNSDGVKIKRFLSRGGLHVLRSIYSIALKKIKKLDQAELYFRSGNKKLDTIPFIPIEYFDVEEFKTTLKDACRVINYDYIVFLDTMIVNHPDSQRDGSKETIEKDLYYRKMQSFFDRIEKSFGYKIVIAAHPKSNYSTEFGERDIIKNKTGELVKYSQYVITHGSLSIDYALLFEKPIAFLKFKHMEEVSNKLFNTYQRMLVARRYLDSVIFDVDDTYFSFKDVNNELYCKFLSDNYLSSSSTFETLYTEFKKLVESK
ncbi:MAG: hypothetical protein ACN6PN_02420 [Sphingobacterium sp.]